MRIELAGVRKRFGAVCALDGVDADLPSGARVALIGPNGSGKSTLIRALLGLVSCEGTVRVGGVSPFDERTAIARRLAYVPQVAPSLAAPVREVVELAACTRELRLSEVEELAKELELDLGAVGDRPFRNLSGGMKQKLLLALALAAKPELLVLDEPTASLDARARDRAFRLVAERSQGATLLLCSHRLDELRQLADRVLCLEEGKVGFDGTVGALVAVRSVEVVEVRGPGAGTAEVLHG